MGSFNQLELACAKQKIFRIKQVIKHDNKKKRALVKWPGYSDEHPILVPFGDLINL